MKKKKKKKSQAYTPAQGGNLTLQAPITTAADYFLIFFSE